MPKLIEVLADMRHDHPVKDDGMKCEGDIIVAQPVGAPWGKEERKVHLITTLDVEGTDQEWTYDKLVSLGDGGEPFPKLIEPFSISEWVDDHDGEHAMKERVNRSEFRIKPGDFDPEDAMNPDKRSKVPSKPRNKGGRAHLKLSDMHHDNSHRKTVKKASDAKVAKTLARAARER